MTDKDTTSNGNEERTHAHLSDILLCELCMDLDSKLFPNKAARVEKKKVKDEMKKRNITFVRHKIIGVFHRDTAAGIITIETCPSKEVITS